MIDRINHSPYTTRPLNEDVARNEIRPILAALNHVLIPELELLRTMLAIAPNEHVDIRRAELLGLRNNAGTSSYAFDRFTKFLRLTVAEGYGLHLLNGIQNKAPVLLAIDEGQPSFDFKTVMIDLALKHPGEFVSYLAGAATSGRGAWLEMMGADSRSLAYYDVARVLVHALAHAGHTQLIFGALTANEELSCLVGKPIHDLKDPLRIIGNNSRSPDLSSQAAAPASIALAAGATEEAVSLANMYTSHKANSFRANVARTNDTIASAMKWFSSYAGWKQVSNTP